jgi:hypothetical protein
MKAVYTLGLSNTSPYSHPKLVDLIRLSGAEVGTRLHSRQTAKHIVKFIANAMHQTFIDFLVKTRPPLSIILDGSSDRWNNHYVLIYLQTTGGNRVVVYFYKLVKLGKPSSAQAYYELVINVFDEDGGAFSKYVKENTIPVVTDGAALIKKTLGTA